MTTTETNPTTTTDLAAEVERLRAANQFLQRKLKLWVEFARTYGDARRVCAFGAPQRPGFICFLCRHDSTEPEGCPNAPKTEGEQKS